MKYSLKIDKEKNKDILTYHLHGAINVTTSIQLENEVKSSIAGVKELIFDFANVNILTSAGIRVLMAANEEIHEKGKLSIINCPDEIKEIFEMTALSEDLHVS